MVYPSPRPPTTTCRSSPTELLEGEARQRTLGLGLFGVHREDAVDDEFEHVARRGAAAQQRQLGDPVVRPHHDPRAPRRRPVAPPLHESILPAAPDTAGAGPAPTAARTGTSRRPDGPLDSSPW